jgi:hypothetical protein
MQGPRPTSQTRSPAEGLRMQPRIKQLVVVCRVTTEFRLGYSIK